ncbi:MAG: ParA family protein [Actinomycetes bacterium]
MSNVVAVLNQKGGVGKTTVALGLAAVAQARGDRCLVVDLDTQGSAGWALGVEASDDHLSVGDVFRTGDPKVAERALVTSGWGEGIDVLPASRNLIDREGDGWDPQNELRLRRAIDGLITGYRFVLVDCAPALGPTTRAGLAAADRVLVVVELSALSLRGAEAVLEEVEHVWAELNPALDVGGVVVNRSLSTSNEGERQARELNRLMGAQAVWRPYIPQRTVVNEAMGHRVPIHDMGYRARDVVEVFEALYDQLVATVTE